MQLASETFDHSACLPSCHFRAGNRLVLVYERSMMGRSLRRFFMMSEKGVEFRGVAFMTVLAVLQSTCTR